MGKRREDRPQAPRKPLGVVFWHQWGSGDPQAFLLCRWCRAMRVRVNGALFCPSCDKVPA